MTLLPLVLAACTLPSGSDALTEAQREALCVVEEKASVGAADSAVAEQLAELYRRPEFAHARSSQTQELIRRLQRWLETLFETSQAETFSNLTRVSVLVLAALAVILLIVRLAGRRRAVARRAAVADEAPLQLDEPGAHLERASALSKEDPRASTRESLLAILAALERQRLARPDRVKTNRELTTELPTRGAPPAMVEAVSGALTWFDRVWYSLEPVEAGTATAFVERARGLVEQVMAWGATR